VGEAGEGGHLKDIRGVYGCGLGMGSERCCHMSANPDVAVFYDDYKPEVALFFPRVQACPIPAVSLLSTRMGIIASIPLSHQRGRDFV